MEIVGLSVLFKIINVIDIIGKVENRHGGHFSRRKRILLRIDMTPMVDLGFLLITFFVFTTTISTPSVTDLYMPRDIASPNPSLLPDRLALTLLLTKDNRIYYYNGAWDDATKADAVFETSFSYMDGIGEVIRHKQRTLDATGKLPDGRRGLMLLIKPAEGATYQNIIDALDEVLINDVKKYAILDPDTNEIRFLQQKE